MYYKIPKPVTVDEVSPEGEKPWQRAERYAPEAVDTLREIMKDWLNPPSSRVQAAMGLLAYGVGKPDSLIREKPIPVTDETGVVTVSHEQRLAEAREILEIMDNAGTDGTNGPNGHVNGNAKRNGTSN